MIPSAAYTAEYTPKLFNGPDNPQNYPFLWGCRPPINTWFLGPTRVSPKRHLDRFSHFCRAHACDQHTERQTHTQTTLRATSVASNRPHLMHCVHAMRPNKQTQNACVHLWVNISRLINHENWINNNNNNNKQICTAPLGRNFRLSGALLKRRKTYFPE